MTVTTLSFILVTIGCATLAVALDPRVSRALGCFLLTWAEGVEWLYTELAYLKKQLKQVLGQLRRGLRDRYREVVQEQAHRENIVTPGA